MILAQETHGAVDLSVAGGGLLLDYAYSGPAARDVIIRADFGAVLGTYTMTVAINLAILAPVSEVCVTIGPAATTVSRPLLLAPGDRLQLFVHGPSSTPVPTKAIVYATSCASGTSSEDGSILVDHNYGGTDALRAIGCHGSPAANVVIRAYTAADYQAGRRDLSFIVGEARTGTDGRWLAPMPLNPGSYVLLYFEAGVFQPRAVPLTVA